MAVVGVGKGVGEASQSHDAAESIVVSLDVLVPACYMSNKSVGCSGSREGAVLYFVKILAVA